MQAYYGLLCLVGLLSLFTFGMKNWRRRSQIILGVSAVSITAVQGLRDRSVGTDVGAYLTGLRLSRDMDFLHGDRLFNFELGYSLYSKFLATMNVTDGEFLFICAAVIIVPIAYTVMKNSRMPGLSVVLYICLGFFAFSFSGLRQSIALAITFYSFRFIRARNLLPFLVCLGLAVLFHTSAIVFGPAYVLYRLDVRRKYMPVALLGVAVAFLLRVQIYGFLYSWYRDSEVVIDNTGALTMFIGMLLLYVWTYSMPNSALDPMPLNGYRSFLLVALVFQSLAGVSNLVMRGGYYYFIFVILLIPELISREKEPRMRSVLAGLFVLFSIWFFQRQSGGSAITPYRWALHW